MTKPGHVRVRGLRQRSAVENGARKRKCNVNVGNMARFPICKDSGAWEPFSLQLERALLL
jgi:hypothetical protein